MDKIKVYAIKKQSKNSKSNTSFGRLKKKETLFSFGCSVHNSNDDHNNRKSYLQQYKEDYIMTINWLKN
ncbi:hypothetical protein BLOT_001422 [Blomia tropicalis]|nr:hypothetical protein BLOT_001422 [Blomia tropicalis]